jgi:hypothetical protein
VGFAWLATGVMLLVSLITADLAFPGDAPIIFSPGLLFGAAALSLTFAGAVFFALALLLLALALTRLQRSRLISSV